MNTENSRHTLPAVFLHAAPIRFTAGKGKRQEYGEISPWKNHFLETEGPVYCMKKRIAAAIVQFRIGILICILIVATWSVFQIGRTKINYDLTRYLSDDTMTKKALAVMQEEFAWEETLRISSFRITGRRSNTTRSKHTTNLWSGLPAGSCAALRRWPGGLTRKSG